MNTQKYDEKEYSPHFNKAVLQAEKTLQDTGKSKKLIQDAYAKAKSSMGNSYVREAWDKLSALFRLVKAYLNGEYTKVPWESLVLAVGAIIYFLSPLDLIPDFIPVIGFSDDLAIIIMVYMSLQPILADFLASEKA
ncbi:MAG: DUF1232 domain-containing protein, partial [Anaerolineae bacterium]|nr:DUF1232 domain-containing protein [Anaerolineae bacterium]